MEKFIYFSLKTPDVTCFLLFVLVEMNCFFVFESKVMLRARSGQFENQIQKVYGDSFSRQIHLDDDWEREFDCEFLAKDLLNKWAGSDKPDRIIMGGGVVFDCTKNELVVEEEN